MKLVVLVDNRKLDEALESEHGLAVYVETEKHKYLLDTGASNAFIRNAEKLGVDLKMVDTVFISHGHADHIGGLEAFLRLNLTAKIILSQNVLSQKYYSNRLGLRKISIELEPSNYKNEFIFIENEAVISDEFKVCSANQLQYAQPIGNKTLFKETEKELVLDDFNHELIACIGISDTLVFVGCGHKGLLNILEAVSKKYVKNIRYVIGGFHLLDSTASSNYESKYEIENLGNALNKKYKHTEFITGHCTGEKAYKLLKMKLGQRLVHFFTGYKLTEY